MHERLYIVYFRNHLGQAHKTKDLAGFTARLVHACLQNVYVLSRFAFKAGQSWDCTKILYIFWFVFVFLASNDMHMRRLWREAFLSLSLSLPTLSPGLRSGGFISFSPDLRKRPARAPRSPPLLESSCFFLKFVASVPCGPRFRFWLCQCSRSWSFGPVLRCGP